VTDVIHAIKNFAVLNEAVERCNQVVLETLGRNTVRESSVAIECFNNGGKRLRPALLILSSMIPDERGCGEVEPGLVDLAGAVELVHLATLFHDDVIDQVDHRRAKLSARLKYGNYVSVLTGDFALAEALDLVQRSGFPEAMPEFVRTLRVLVRGESLESTHKYDFAMTEAQYYDIISEKSASLFALSCKVGGMMHGTQYADILGHFGWNLGMAFQMIDDLDDMLADPNRSSDCDLRNGYLALPLIRALNHVGDGHRDALIRIIENADFGPMNERFIVSVCLENGTIADTRKEIQRHLDRADAALERFGDGEPAGLLRHIVKDLRSYADGQVDNFAAFVGSAG